jgi:predicted phage replisome organizer
MAEVKWIRIVTDIFDNRKIKIIRKMPEGDTIVVTWFQILCLAGETNDNGLIYITRTVPYTEETLATAFDTPLSVVRLSLETFERLEMIHVYNSFLCVSNWEKYQNVDGLEKIREQTRIRVARYKQKQKELTQGNVTVTLPVTHGNATEGDIDIDIDKETPPFIPPEGEKKRETRFIPPLLEQVAAYCAERNNGIDSQMFIDFYASKGWMIGKNKMKDWKAAIRTWEQKRKSEQLESIPPPRKGFRIMKDADGKEYAEPDEQ